MIFQEQLNDLPDTYSRNYKDCQPVAGKRQQNTDFLGWGAEEESCFSE